MVCDGKSTALIVDGIVLEAAYHLPEPNRDLLFVTDDVPFEEGLHIYLLDHTVRLLDTRTLLLPYCPGLLESLDVVGPNVVEFSFQGRRRVVVHPSRRGFLWRHHLELISLP